MEKCKHRETTYRFDNNIRYILLDRTDHICIYRRPSRWYSYFWKQQYYFSTSPTSKLLPFTKVNVKRVYKGTEFEYLINEFTRIAKITAMEDKELNRFSICRLLDSYMSNALYYKIALDMKKYEIRHRSS